MQIQQIRNATLKITYADVTFLLDPWLQDQGTGMCAGTVRPEMAGVRSPLDPLPVSPEEILSGVDYCLVTHVHPDHFTPDYLPKEMKILAQNDIDCISIKEMGFSNTESISDIGMKIGAVSITKTPAVHGDNEQVAAEMGEVSGYLLSGEEKSLYIAGDTVFYEGVEETLRKCSPDVIIVNCCEATLPGGRLIMNLQDLEAVCRLCPVATVIATHLDSVNHALLTSEDVRMFAAKKNLKQVIVLQSGERIQR